MSDASCRPEVATAVGYAHAFRVVAPGADADDALTWARSVFERAPAALRWFIVFGWRFVLRLRMQTSSADTVLGWQVRHAERGAACIATGSALLDSELDVAVSTDEVTVHSRVQFRSRTGRALWAVVRPVHHIVLPLALRSAARRHTRARTKEGR